MELMEQTALLLTRTVQRGRTAVLAVTPQQQVTAAPVARATEHPDTRV